MKYRIEETASFDIDAQKGFTPLCPDELPVPQGDLIADELNRNARFARFRIGSKDAHNPRALWVADGAHPQFSPVGLPNADVRWNSHCNVGSRGFELLDGLPDPLDYDFFVWKGIENHCHPYGACYHDLADKRSTGVIEFLKCQGVKTLIIGGLATDYCVKTTVLQLLAAGFQVVVNLKACRGIAEDTVQAALMEMRDRDALLAENIEEIMGEPYDY